MLCGHFGLAFIHSLYLPQCRFTAKVISWFHWNVGLRIDRTYRTVGDPVLDMDSRSIFRFLHHCELWDFRRYITISHSHYPIFMKLGEMSDADKVMNPQHFGRDPADIRIRIRINPLIQIWIPDHFWLKCCRWRRFALSEHCLVCFCWYSQCGGVHSSSTVVSKTN